MLLAVNAVAAAVGGARTHLASLLPHLLALGREHHFHTFVSSEDVETFRVAGAPNATWEIVPVSGFSTARRILWENTVLPHLLARLRPDVVFCPANLSHFASGPPRVIVVHNVLPFHPQIFARDHVRQRLRLRLLAHATQHFLRRAEGVIFLSRSGRADCLKGASHPPEMEAVIYHGVDPRFGRGSVAEAARAIEVRFGITGGYILTVSHLYPYKRIDALVAAFARLGPGVLGERRLVIAGAPYDAAYSAMLTEQIERLALTDRVMLLGSVGYDDLSLLHAAADVVAFLSICENCPNSVLEALASGRPLLLSERSVMPELAADAALYVDPDRVEDVAEKLARLLHEPSLRETLSARAVERARCFDWCDSARATMDLLLRVGASRRERGTA